MDIYELVRTNLKRIRTEKGLSQEEVAVRMGSQQPLYARIELGETSPTLRTLINVCEALECEVADLFIPMDQIELNERFKRIGKMGSKRKGQIIGLIDLAMTKGSSIHLDELNKRLRILKNLRANTSD